MCVICSRCLTFEVNRRRRRSFLAVGWNDELGVNFNELAVGMWLRHRSTLTLDILKMKFDCFLNQLQYFFFGFPYGNASGEIWYIRPETFWTFLNHHHVAHNNLLFQTRLLQRTVERSGRNINAGFSCNRYGSRFRRVMKLPMASLLPHLQPAVSLNQRDEFSYFDLSKAITFSTNILNVSADQRRATK